MSHIVRCDYCGSKLTEHEKMFGQLAIGIRRYADVSIMPLEEKWTLCKKCLAAERYETLVVLARWRNR